MSELQIGDGHLEAASVIALPPGSLIEQVENATKYRRDEFHAELVSSAAQRAALEISAWHRWVSELVQPYGIDIRVGLADGYFYWAKIIQPNARDRRFDVILCLGSLQPLIGLANRFEYYERFSGDWSYNEFHIFDNWHPDNSPTGSLWMFEGGFGRTERVALDSLTMMFLHEVGHAVHGHFQWPEYNGREFNHARFQRAAEAQADIAAGSMFLRGIRENSHWPDFSADPRDAVIRLVRAADVNHLVLQATQLEDSPRYHLAFTRTRCMLRGGDEAWRFEGCLPVEFAAIVNEFRMSYWSLFALAPMQIAGWIAYSDPRTAADEAAFREVSLPIINRRKMEAAMRLRDAASRSGLLLGRTPI